MRLLVVEDEVDMAAYIAKGLRQHGYVVDISHDGEDGLFMATHESYDLVILDLMLPKMDGLSVLRTMRNQGAQVPVIVLTAKDAVEDRVQGLDRGADDYMVKPFAFSELVARVRACLRRKNEPMQGELRVGDVVLNPLTRRVDRGSEMVDLTAVEYRLLEYLMRHAGEVVTRVQISEHVWDYHFDSLSNTIDVHIYKLRGKIEPPGSKKLIHTVRGAGYVVQERE